MPFNHTKKPEKDLLLHQLKSQEPSGTQPDREGRKGIYNVNDLLQKHEIIPLVRNVGESVQLGKGAYGTVYRAVYQGHEVAVKLSRDLRDVDNWKAILLAAQGMPADLRKHLPKIYKLIKDVDEGGPLGIVVVELLKPLPDNTKKMISMYFEGDWDEKTTRPEAILEVMKDPNLLYNVFNAALGYIIRPFSYPIPSEVIQKWFKIILDLKPMSLKQNLFKEIKSRLVGVIGEDLMRIYESTPEIEKKRKRPFTKSLSNALAEDFGYELERLAREQARGGAFPTHYNEKTEIYSVIPEFKTLLEALGFLKHKDVKWRDLHYENMMMRPSTGDIVITDVGLFESSWDMSGVS